MPNPFQKLGGLFSTPQVNGGIFGDGATDAYDPRMAFATELLSQSGYAPYKRPFGELLGQAMQSAQKARALGIDRQRQKQLQDAQLALTSAQTANAQNRIVPAGSTVLGPDGNPVFEAPTKETGTNSRFGNTQIGDNGNLYVLDHQAGTYNDTGVKASTNLQLVTLPDGSVVAVPKRAPEGGAAPQRQEIVSPDEAISGAADRAAAESRAKTMAENTAKAEFDYPRIEQNADFALQTIRDLKSAPGLQYITGKYSLSPIIPDTSQAAADALAKQVEGKTFLEAYQTLRGGGQITEQEGTKATAAMARLYRAQSKEDYVSALNDLEEVISAGLGRAKKQAGVKGDAPPSNSPKRFKVDLEGNVIGN